MKFRFLLCLLFFSCSIDPVKEQYENRWQLSLSENPDSREVFGGINLLPDQTLVAFSQSISTTGGIDLKSVQVSNDGELIDENIQIIENQIIDITQSSRGETVDLLSRPTNVSGIRTVIKTDVNLNMSLEDIDLSDPLSFTLPALNYISPKSLAYTGINLEQTGYSVFQTDRQGQFLWLNIFPNRPIDMLIGSDEQVFVLTRGNDEERLLSIDHNGNTNWDLSITGEESIVSDMSLAEKIYGSPSNTISVLGSNQANILLAAFIDPRGEFIFQREYVDYTISDLKDFLVTRDGGFLMAVSFSDSISGSGFRVTRLNHRAVITWQSEYQINQEPNDVFMVENEDRAVTLITTEGEMFQIGPR